MIETVMIRDVQIGGGAAAKICVPLVSGTAAELLGEAAVAAAAGADLAEWRMDFFRRAGDAGAAIETLKALRAALGPVPLLATFRTAAEGGCPEGGEAVRDSGAYARLLAAIAESGAADAVDVELSAGGEAARRVIGAARGAGAASVASRHYFGGTPRKSDIVAQFEAMRAMGADIPKVAAMPSCFGDVLELMSAAYEYTSRAGRPVIAMSMGQTGCVSRVAGGLFGSAVTFCKAASGASASAPGQLGVAEARAAMALLGGLGGPNALGGPLDGPIAKSAKEP
ncbi:MAG: type I 3-dehydroquinate dehydratase [Clostridiales bacterium]|jgi:3-dehydroquinate dehydratase-1|nr:type I 3-dehydroquinate dehydratase [Clostridiales bacterium]